MNRYLIVDCMSDWKKLSDLKGLKELLVEQVIQDMENNYDEKDIVKCNVKILKALSLDKMKLNDIEEELGAYSFKIIDLLQFNMDLSDVAAYFYNDDNKFDEFYDKIIKGVENND